MRRCIHVSVGTFVLFLASSTLLFAQPTPFGDQYFYSAENFQSSFGVVIDAEDPNMITDFGSPPAMLTFDGVAELAGDMMVNERAVVWPGVPDGIPAVQAAGIDGVTDFLLDIWQNPGEVIEFSFTTADGGWISGNPAAPGAFSITGIDWPHAEPGTMPSFFPTGGFYFYFTNDGVPLTGYSTAQEDIGLLVGEHPFDASISEVIYIAFSSGQVDRATDVIEGGMDFRSSSRQLADDVPWAALTQVMSLPPISGNGFHVGLHVTQPTIQENPLGDFNGDNVVDVLDFDILRSNFQQAGNFGDGDMDFNGFVDLHDFAAFKQAFAAANPGAAVPEPGAMLLIALGGVLLLAYPARRGMFRRLARPATTFIRSAAIKATTAGALACVAMTVNFAWAQGETTIQFNVLPSGDWNTDVNWKPIPDSGLTFLPGQDFPEEIVGISNGGTVMLTAGAPFPVSAVVIGETGQFPEGGPAAGTLTIASGGSLIVTPAEAALRTGVHVGSDGLGVLNLSGSGEFSSLDVGGAAESALNISGAANLSVVGDARISRTMRVTGPDAAINVAGDLRISGALVAEITDAAHSTINVPTGTAILGGALRVEFNGHAPSFGDRWTLIDAASVFGGFSSVDTSAAGLERGLTMLVETADSAGGGVTVSVANQLILAVDEVTGAARVENVIGGAVNVDGYSILSASGSLSMAGWSSFSTSGVAGQGWAEARPTAQNLSELRLQGSTALDVDAHLALGNLFDVNGERDLIFEYTTIAGDVRSGLVEYVRLSTPLTGDTNGDGVVDLEDLNNVRNNFGGVGMPVLGDTNNDGVVDLEDLNNVRNNFGAMAAAAVPEPAGLLLVCFGAVAAWTVVGRRR